MVDGTSSHSGLLCSFSLVISEDWQKLKVLFFVTFHFILFLLIFLAWEDGEKMIPSLSALFRNLIKPNITRKAIMLKVPF
jgi:hypothetical protein